MAFKQFMHNTVITYLDAALKGHLNLRLSKCYTLLNFKPTGKTKRVLVRFHEIYQEYRGQNLCDLPEEPIISCT